MKQVHCPSCTDKHCQGVIRILPKKVINTTKVFIQTSIDDTIPEYEVKEFNRGA